VFWGAPLIKGTPACFDSPEYRLRMWVLPRTVYGGGGWVGVGEGGDLQEVAVKEQFSMRIRDYCVVHRDLAIVHIWHCVGNLLEYYYGMSGGGFTPIQSLPALWRPLCFIHCALSCTRSTLQCFGIFHSHPSVQLTASLRILHRTTVIHCRKSWLDVTVLCHSLQSTHISLWGHSSHERLIGRGVPGVSFWFLLVHNLSVSWRSHEPLCK